MTMVIKGPGFANGTIILKEPGAVLYSGQLLIGNVHFELNETITYSAINLVYLGEALVERSEVQYEMYGGENRSRNVCYKGQEQYFNSVQCVRGGSGIFSLQPGVHSIPFEFQVPFNAPSSYKGEDGVIQYCVTAYMEYPEPGHREELVKEFQIVAPISPHTLSKMKQPLELDFEEINTCNCFCKNSPINLKVALPSAAFHVGTSIPINIKLQNNTSVDIYEISLKITKRHSCRTQQPPSEYSAPEETLAELKGPVLDDLTCHLVLPPVVLPNLESCSIMDVAYFFKVKVQMTGCNEPLEDESEIVIGVLPQPDVSEVSSVDLAAQLPKAPIPDPNNLPIGFVTPRECYPTGNLNSQQYGPRNVPASGCPAPPYPASNVNSYPYPGVGGSPYPGGQPPFNPNSSQQNKNIAITPTAPSLYDIEK